MAADTDIETDTESSPPDRIERPEQTSSTSETNSPPTTETQSSYQFREDQIKELDEYEETEEGEDLRIGSGDTATRDEYSGPGGCVDASYQFREDQIEELDEYEENEENNDLEIGSGETTTRDEYAGSSGYIDTEIDHDVEDQPPSEYQQNLANQDDHIGDTDPIISSERALDDSYDDRADRSQAAHTTYPDETEIEPEESTESHPDPGDVLEPSVDARWLPDDEPASRTDKLGDGNRILDEEQPDDKQPLEDSLDETDSGVDTRPIPESPIGDDSDVGPGADTYHDAQDTEPPAAIDTSSSNNGEFGGTDHILDDERPADNDDVTIGLDSQQISPETADKTNSDPAADDADWEGNTFSSGVAQTSSVRSYPDYGDLLEKSDITDASLEGLLQQGQYPLGSTEGISGNNKKLLPVPHNDAHTKSHVSSPEIADGPVSPLTGLASGTGEQAHLLAVANQDLPAPAVEADNQTVTQEVVGQPQGSTVDIYKPPSAEPDNTPHPAYNGAKQSEPAADSTVKNSLNDSAAALSTSESDISDGDHSIPAATEIDNSAETDSDTREDTQDTLDEQSVAQSDPELAPLGQPIQFGSVQAAQDNYPPGEGITDTIPPQDHSTQVADASEELAEPATEAPLEQIRGSGNIPTEDDENSTEDRDDVIRSSTDATADESDPDSQLNDNLERPENPRNNAKPQDQLDKCGDPIDIATGNVVLHQTDVELAGVLPLILTRTHVSSYRAGRSFGPSWACTLDQRLKIDEDGACYAGADGLILVYPPATQGVAVFPEEGPRWPLTRTSADTYTISDPQRGHTLHFTPVIPNNPVLPLTAITDRNQNRIDFDYTPEGTPTQIQHSAGYRITIDTSNHRITALHLLDLATHTAHTLIRYTYDSHNHLTEIINSSGLPLQFDYDTQGRITSWQDRNHTCYHYTYNQAGRCIRTTGSEGYMNATLTYNLNNRTTTFTNSLGHVTTFHLNKLGQVIGETDPLGHVTTSEWDRYDRLLARTDPLTRTTRYTYDPTGNLAAVTRPDGSHTNATYNTLQLPTSITDYDGTVWLRNYDQQGNLTTLTNPLGATTHYTHNKHGHLATITDTLGNTHHINTNPAGLPTTITNPRGASTHYKYDAFGRVVAITDPIGGTTRLGWSIEGKLTWHIQPNGASEHFTYDGEGNLTEHLNPTGGLTRTQYTHFDLPATQIGPDGARLEFGYDTELHLTSVTNPQDLTWHYDYDPTGNLIRETDFNNRILAYTHDPARQLIARTNGLGQTTHYIRDQLGNIIKQHSTDTTATFAYDPLGRIIAATNTDTKITLQRDPLGQIVAETCNGRTLTSTYNSLGHRIHRRTPTGAESTWEYDTNNHHIALHTAGRTLRFTYDAAGRETQRHLGNNILLTQTWDANHHLLSQTLTTNRPDPQRPQSAHLIQRRSYTYRPDGYPTTIDDHLTGTRHFDLDPTGRITTVHGSGWTEHYAYDPAGNITHATWPTPPHTDSLTADAQGTREYTGTLIRRAGNIRYRHDTQGRIIIRQQKRLSAKPLTWHYTWNSDDRLIGVRTPDGTHWCYHYDPLGRRIAKQRLANDNSTVVEQVTFTWDGQILAEQTHTSELNEPERTTVWEWEPNTFHPISQTEHVSLRHASQGPPDAPHDVRDAPQEWIDQKFYAIITDLIGTPTEMLNPDGTLVWHPHTTLWGTTVAVSLSDVSCPLRFPGQYHDPETALNYNYHRYYDPATSRYGSNDPLGLAPAPNPHSYVHNPMRWTDPVGLAPGECIHSRYPDGTPVYEGQQPPRISGPDPAANGAPHSVLRWDNVNNRIYQAREYGEAGRPVRDIDFTHPTYPNGTLRPDHVAPEQHRWLPNPTGGTPVRGPGEPMEWS